MGTLTQPDPSLCQAILRPDSPGHINYGQIVWCGGRMPCGYHDPVKKHARAERQSARQRIAAKRRADFVLSRNALGLCVGSVPVDWLLRLKQPDAMLAIDAVAFIEPPDA